MASGRSAGWPLPSVVLGLSSVLCPLSSVLCGPADPDRRLANQTRDDGAAVVLLDEHELPTLRLRALHGEDHRTSSDETARSLYSRNALVGWVKRPRRRSRKGRTD